MTIVNLTSTHMIALALDPISASRLAVILTHINDIHPILPTPLERKLIEQLIDILQPRNADHD